MCSAKSKTMTSIIGASCLVFLAAGSECTSRVVECVGQEDSVFLQLNSPSRSKLTWCFRGAQLKVKFVEFSVAILVFTVFWSHQHRSSVIEAWPSISTISLSVHARSPELLLLVLSVRAT